MSYVAIAAAAAAAIGGAVASSGGSGGSSKKAYSAKNTNKRLEKFAEIDPSYMSSPYAQNNLGMAQTLLNSRMAGASSRQNNILTGGANVRSGISRNATDSSQALALMAGTQGQSDQSFNDLAIMEGQDATMKQQNLMNANRDMTAEGDKVHDDNVRRWQDQVNIAMTQYKIRTKRRADAAKVIGGIFTGGSSVISAASDKRLKHNYNIVGKSPSGINIYHFSYLGSDTIYEGVLAQEVPQAAFDMGNGLLAVNYSKIDVQFKQVS